MHVGLRGTGTFWQSAGTNAIANDLTLGSSAGSSGTYNLSGSGQLSAAAVNVGFWATGTFLQSGGTNTVASNVYLGSGRGSSGTYNLSGSGQLSASNEYVGYSGTGTFTQSAGTNSISGNLYLAHTSSVVLGNYVPSNGSYNLSGSGRLSAQNEYVGNSATGVFTQSGGTNSTSALNLANGASASGTYNLNGGLLLTGSIGQGAGAAAFNLGGGTLQAASSFTINAPIAINSGNSTIDTHGFDVTVTGNLAGSGSLTKAGLGTLALMGANSYTGDTHVDAGVLKAVALTSTASTITVGVGLAQTATLEVGYLEAHKLVVRPGSVVVLGGVTGSAAAADLAAPDFAANVASTHVEGFAAGAASPLPEPTTILLLCSGGLVLAIMGLWRAVR